MKLPDSLAPAATAALLAACPGPASADTAAPTRSVALGYMDIRFNTASGELTGPPGLTPPGMRVDLEDTRGLGMSLSTRLTSDWSLMAQLGAPPVIRMNGAGTAASVGEVARAKAWSPSVLFIYALPPIMQVRPFAGAGLGHVSFSGREVSSAYTAALAGTASTLSINNSVAPMVSLGLELPLSAPWFVEASYSHAWIRSEARIDTETPGLGTITRRIDIRSDPDVYCMKVGYRF